MKHYQVFPCCQSEKCTYFWLQSTAQLLEADDQPQIDDDMDITTISMKRLGIFWEKDLTEGSDDLFKDGEVCIFHIAVKAGSTPQKGHLIPESYSLGEANRHCIVRSDTQLRIQYSP